MAGPSLPSGTSPSGRGGTGSGGTGVSDPDLASGPRVTVVASMVTPSALLSSGGRRRVDTPESALDLDEAERTRALLWFLIVLVGAVMVGIFFMDADPAARDIHLGGLALLGAGAVLLRVRFADPSRYRPWHILALGHVAVVTMGTAFLFWGPLSAAILVLPFGAFLFALGRHYVGALSILVHCMASHGTFTLLLAGGVLRDRSLVRPHMSFAAQVVAEALIQSVFVLTFVMARRVRKQTEQTLAELEGAAREVAQREAVLVEARQELERALALGGLGRYSEQVVGAWRLGAVLGRGAMGEVYEAAHVTTGAPAAVKLMSPHLLSDPGHLRRFLREARVVASLDAPNVVTVLQVADPGDALPFIAMERLHGHTLAQHLKREIRLSVNDTARLVSDVAKALDAAHAAQVVHRDLKPQNVFRCEPAVGRPPVWKVLDFGTSKLLGSGDVTRGGLVGTPSYMAPEQARGQPIDGRADVYSLGVVAYRCLTGQAAFPGEDVAAIVYAVVHDHPKAPTALVADLPRDVELVLGVAMHKQRERRFASAGEFAEAFAQAARGALPEAVRQRARGRAGTTNWSV
jgi:serine/threonine-protein kinase